MSLGTLRTQTRQPARSHCGAYRPDNDQSVALHAHSMVNSAWTTTSSTRTPKSQGRGWSGPKNFQQQVGHECDSPTALYTDVSDDFMNTALNRALAPAFAGS
jgi:hypothetical protein